jgi:hypothetical protein
MKYVFALLATIALISTASAVEYVTLTQNTLSKAIPAGAIVEIVGWGGPTNDTQGQGIVLTFADGNVESFALTGGTPTTVNPISGRHYVFAGLSSVTLNGIMRFSVTLKITPASEVNVVTSGVVTLPAVTGQGFAVTLEQSTDLINFSPVSPGTFTGAATPQFFRVRMQQVVAP